MNAPRWWLKSSLSSNVSGIEAQFDRDERFTHAVAVLIESALLTRTGFGVSKYSDRLSRDASNVLVEVAAITDDGGTRRDCRAHFHGFGCQSASRGSFVDELEQLLNIEEFNHVLITSAGLLQLPSKKEQASFSQYFGKSRPNICHLGLSPGNRISSGIQYAVVGDYLLSLRRSSKT